MRILGRSLGAILLVISAVGMIACAASVIAIWVGRSLVVQRIERIETRLDAAIQRASSATRDVLGALETAREDVNRVGKDSAGLGSEPAKDRRTTGRLRKLIDREVGPNIGELRGRLATASEAAVVTASLLRSFQDLPLGQSSRIDPDKLERTTEQAAQLSAALQKLQAAIGEGDQPANEREVLSSANDIDLVLQRCQATVEDWQSQLEATREALAYFESHVNGWLAVVTIAVTVLCVWMGLGQISLSIHGWKRFRSA